MAGQPKTPFYIVLFLVVGGLVAFAAYQAEWLFPKAQPKGGIGYIDPNELMVPEAPDSKVATTVQEYEFKPFEKLPPVTGVSGYTSLSETDNTVKFALNVWAGWGPIILANEGFKPGKVWKTQDGREFKVELVLSDDPIAMRQNYAAGNLHIGWATLDMLPLFMEGFVDAKDSRIMPRVYQQVDWSNGGDGIVVRDHIKSIKDLVGQKIALAINAPSHYFALNMLVTGGVQPADVIMVPTGDAFQAAAAFNNNPGIAACVSWAPDIYTLTESENSGNRMLVSTKDANKLIADVWFARADFAKDHPDIIEALVRGIFDAMEDLKDPAKKTKCAELMAAGYNIPASETIGMFGDAHSTNVAENVQFFMNKNNPANFEHVWKKAYYLYRKVGSITHQPVSFDSVMDFSIVEKLSKEPKYASQKDEYVSALPARSVAQIEAESDEILAKKIVIRFFPNSSELRKTIMQDLDGKTVERLFDPNVDLVLKEAGEVAKQFGNARLVIEGHTDSSMFGKVPPSMVKELSQDRAENVRKELVSEFGVEPGRINAIGYGWDRPAVDGDHAMNRRVEIRVFTAEKQ